MALNYQPLYDQLNQRLTVLCGRRDEIELELGDLIKEIQAIEETLSHLAPLCGYIFNPTTIGNLKISQAVAAVLNAEKRMSVADVRKEMEERGFSFSSYTAPSATLHTVLKRLVDAGKATIERENYRTFYKAVGPEISDEDIPF